MDIPKLQFPPELMEHNLSPQELALIPEANHNIAKGLNITKRQGEWTMREVVATRNYVVDALERIDKKQTDMQTKLEYWERIRWGVITLTGILLAGITVLKQLGFIK